MSKVLLVEDDKSLREIYGVRLLAEGYDIVSAGDGEEALAMAIKEKPQLIISDVMMPKISGFDMLDILRSTTETKEIKVIMMTALSSDDQRARGEQLGADKYLVKSQVGIEDVVRTVHEVLGDTGATAAAPAADTKPADTAPLNTSPAPATDTAAPADDSVKPAADDASSDAKPSEALEDTATSSLAPGNDSAGPLPPQPSELKEEPKLDTENSLPQPTAPFSSPRPANLGESVIHPEETVSTDASTAPEAPVEAEPVVSPEESDQLHSELQATSDPVATQVDTPVDDNDETSTVEPPVGTPVSSDGGLGLNLDPQPTETPAPEPSPLDTPATPLVSETPTEGAPVVDEHKDEQAQPPAATPGTPS